MRRPRSPRAGSFGRRVRCGLRGGAADRGCLGWKARLPHGSHKAGMFIEHENRSSMSSYLQLYEHMRKSTMSAFNSSGTPWLVLRPRRLWCHTREMAMRRAKVEPPSPGQGPARATRKRALPAAPPDEATDEQLSAKQARTFLWDNCTTTTCAYPSRTLAYVTPMPAETLRMQGGVAKTAPPLPHTS